MIIEEVKSNYVWKKVGDDVVLVKSGEKDIDNEKKHLITLSRMNKNFPYTVYVKGKENKKLQSELPSDNLKEIKDYILKNIDKILGNKINEDYSVKSPLDYIEEKLQDANIDYTIEQAMDGRPYDTWITINDGQDSLADEIICSVVGYAYEWVRDKFGNRKYCKVATDEDTIQELNENLKENENDLDDVENGSFVAYGKSGIETIRDAKERNYYIEYTKEDSAGDPRYFFIIDKTRNYDGSKKNKSLDDAYPNSVKYAVVYRNLEDDSLIDAKVYDDIHKAQAVYSAEMAKGSDGYTYVDIEEVTPESSLWEESLKENKDDGLKSMVLSDTLERQSFISFAYEDQDGSTVATTSWEKTPRKAHSNYISTREFLGNKYDIKVLRQENRDGNKEFAYVMKITPKNVNENLKEDLESGDCVYHPGRDTYYYLKKHNDKSFELYEYRNGNLVEAHPFIIDIGSPFYKQLMLQTKRAMPSLKENKENDKEYSLQHPHYVEYENEGQFDNAFLTNYEYNQLKNRHWIKILVHKILNKETGVYESLIGDEK